MFETELLSTEIDFWRRAARIYRLLKVRHEVIRKKNGGHKAFWEDYENVFTGYGHVLLMEDNRWSKRRMTWSPEGRRWRRRPEVEWEKKEERVMKERNLTIIDAVNRQLAATAKRYLVDQWKLDR